MRSIKGETPRPAALSSLKPTEQVGLCVSPCTPRRVGGWWDSEDGGLVSAPAPDPLQTPSHPQWSPPLFDGTRFRLQRGCQPHPRGAPVCPALTSGKKSRVGKQTSPAVPLPRADAPRPHLEQWSRLPQPPSLVECAGEPAHLGVEFWGLTVRGRSQYAHTRSSCTACRPVPLQVQCPWPALPVRALGCECVVTVQGAHFRWLSPVPPAHTLEPARLPWPPLLGKDLRSPRRPPINHQE